MLNFVVTKLDSYPDVQLTEGQAGFPYHYQFADLKLCFPSAVPSLDFFSVTSFSSSSLVSRCLNTSQMTNPSDYHRLYSGHAPLANKLRSFEAFKQGAVVYLKLDGAVICRIDLEQSHIHLFNFDDFDSALNLELITGPALMILMAASNQYCLHAGAVSLPNANVAFIAESGAGKSTLSGSASANWRQLADDIVPVEVVAGQGLMKSFPQLKLDACSSGINIDAPLPLHAVMRLNPEPKSQIQLRRLPQRDAVLQLVRHTVGVRLFAADVLENHLRLMKQLSSLVPVIEVSYPRNLEQLDSVRGAIYDYLN